MLSFTGDSFALYSFHMRFSTIDQDNDNSQEHCAKVTKGPWWYNECYGANLNREYRAPDGGKTDISWSYWNLFHHYKKLKITSKTSYIDENKVNVSCTIIAISSLVTGLYKLIFS